MKDFEDAIDESEFTLVSPESETDYLLAEYVAIDLETTGLDPQQDEIIELGAVRFVNGIPVDRFEKFVKPLFRKLSTEITELTGITPGQLKHAPHLTSVAKEFVAFVGKSQLVGQNLAFDLGFLSQALATSAHFTKAKTAPRSHDTGLTARFLFPCLDSYGLAHLSQLFQTDVHPRHRAADDAKATGELFQKLLTELMALPLDQISTGIRLLETTTSPLLNTLRAVQKRVKLTGPVGTPRSPFWRSDSGRDNIFQSEGLSKPTQAVPDEQLRKLFMDRNRFEKVLPAYEYRPQQIEMASSVSTAFRDGKVLAIEAGTGVGKSMGYLAPALLSGSRVVISTHTKNLQDQLFYDELPRLGQVFKFGFSAALLKGRRNYLCRTKWRDAALDPERLPVADREKAAFLVRWVTATKSGDLSEVTAIRGDEAEGIMRFVASEPGYCTTKTCAGSECPLIRIRKAAMKADLVIVNHSLVLSDFSSDGALFGEISKIVFDEAHHLEDVATDHFGTTISMPVLKGALERVGSVVRRKGELAINASALPNHELVVPILEDTTRTINDLIGKLEPFFSGLRLLVKDVHTDRNYSTPVRYSSSDLLCQAIRAYTGDISDDIGHVVKDLLKLIERIVPFEESYLTPTIVQDVRNGVQDLNECATALEYSLDASREDRVYWVEIPAWANQPVMLKTAPLDVAVLLADSIFQRLDASILTSATLTTGGVSGFHHLQERLGLNLLEEGKFQFAAHGSPFDYNRNCLTLSASFPPHPSETPIDHSNCVAEVCAQLAQELHRGMLVLFTSYESLKRVEKELKRLLFGSDVEVLVQLGRSDRDRLIRRFRSGHGSILLGADSLWEGIDVPGAALEVVVIAKLPFDVPGDPVVSARIDQLRQQQRNPFFDYQLPSAILRTRQGAGRLIRTATDRGVVILLDPRITSKGYGRQIVRALPGRNAQAASIDELSDMASQFFAEESV